MLFNVRSQPEMWNGAFVIRRSDKRQSEIEIDFRVFGSQQTRLPKGFRRPPVIPVLKVNHPQIVVRVVSLRIDLQSEQIRAFRLGQLSLAQKLVRSPKMFICAFA